VRLREVTAQIVAAFVSAGALPHARAAEPVSEVDPIALHWDAPATCPGADRVREHAKQRMGTDGATPVVAHGVVRSIDASTWVLTLSLEGEGGREDREIRAASCDALAEAAGLLIAVAADPSRASVPAVAPEPATSEPATSEPATTEPATAEPTTSTPAPGPATPTPTVVASPTPRRRRVSGAARAELGGQFLRVLPRAADVTFGGALALRMPLSRVELRGRYALAQRIEQNGLTDVGGTIDLWTLGASGCFAPRWRRLEFPICAGVELGAMRGRSFGVEQSGRARSLLAAIPIDANLVWSPVPRVGLLAGAGVAPSLVRPSFHLRDQPPLFRAGPVALRVVVGVELRFP
jgi:hypothetical protein